MAEQLKPTRSEITEAVMKINPDGRLAGAAISDIEKLVEWAIEWNTCAPSKPDAELVGQVQKARDEINFGITPPTKEQIKFYDLLGRCLTALAARPDTEQDIANKIAKRLPIWMLDTYDKDSLSSMLSAVAYLKQQVSNQSD